jgi:hypothetical protein
LRIFGGAPLFFYLVHLWLLRLAYDAALALGITGASGRVEVASPGQLWLLAAGFSLPLYAACRWMVRLKRSGASPWLSYL